MEKPKILKVSNLKERSCNHQPQARIRVLLINKNRYEHMKRKNRLMKNNIALREIKVVFVVRSSSLLICLLHPNGWLRKTQGENLER